MKINIGKYINIILVVLVIVLFVLLNRSCKSNSEKSEYINDLGDEIELSENENCEQKATINELVLSSKKSFLLIKSKDSSIIKLQGIVKDYKGKITNAIVLENETFVYSVDTVNVITTHTDTVVNDSIIYVYPTYYTEWNTKWEVGSIRASKDSITRVNKIINDFEISIGKPSNGWFKNREYKISVVNKNPNTKTSDLKSINLKPKQNRFNVSAQFGYGLGLSSMKFQPYLGVGVGFVIVGVK